MSLRALAAILSWVLITVCVVAYGWLGILLPHTIDRYGVIAYNLDIIPFYYVGLSLAIFGMVILPYFGVASVGVTPSSIWKRAKAMIDAHVSFPFLGGTMLLLGRLAPLPYGYNPGDLGYNFGIGLVLTIYLLFVILVSLISIMANRSSPLTTQG